MSVFIGRGASLGYPRVSRQPGQERENSGLVVPGYMNPICHCGSGGGCAGCWIRCYKMEPERSRPGVGRPLVNEECPTPLRIIHLHWPLPCSPICLFGTYEVKCAASLSPCRLVRSGCIYDIDPTGSSPRIRTRNRHLDNAQLPPMGTNKATENRGTEDFQYRNGTGLGGDEACLASNHGRYIPRGWQVTGEDVTDTRAIVTRHFYANANGRT